MNRRAQGIHEGVHGAEHPAPYNRNFIDKEHRNLARAFEECLEEIRADTIDKCN
jgi:hypothetical protein